MRHLLSCASLLGGVLLILLLFSHWASAVDVSVLFQPTIGVDLGDFYDYISGLYNTTVPDEINLSYVVVAWNPTATSVYMCVNPVNVYDPDNKTTISCPSSSTPVAASGEGRIECNVSFDSYDLNADGYPVKTFVGPKKVVPIEVNVIIASDADCLNVLSFYDYNAYLVAYDHREYNLIFSASSNTDFQVGPTKDYSPDPIFGIPLGIGSSEWHSARPAYSCRSCPGAAGMYYYYDPYYYHAQIARTSASFSTVGYSDCFVVAYIQHSPYTSTTTASLVGRYYMVCADSRTLGTHVCHPATAAAFTYFQSSSKTWIQLAGPIPTGVSDEKILVAYGKPFVSVNNGKTIWLAPYAVAVDDVQVYCR